MLFFVILLAIAFGAVTLSAFVRWVVVATTNPRARTGGRDDGATAPAIRAILN
jgi:hypothetical protein